MSIYCSIFGFDEDSTLPIIYQGSHVLPSARDKRGGEFGISAIPSFITRNHKDNGPEDKWHPYLRVHLTPIGNRDTVILTRKQVERLRNALNDWLERQIKP